MQLLYIHQTLIFVFMVCPLKSDFFLPTLKFVQCLTGVEEVPKEYDGPIMRKLIEHTRNDEKESRYRQPDL